MNICLAFSKNWSEHVAVELFSIFYNNKGIDIKIYLLSDGLKDTDLVLFDNVCNYFSNENNKCSYKYIDMTNIYPKYITNDKNVDDHFTKYTLYRLIIPEIINEDRLLYLDSDMIINGNLSELYDSNFRTSLVLGVEDIGLNIGRTYDYKEKIGLKSDSKYINGGLLLLNLKRIKSLDLHKQWIDMCNSTFYDAHDQDIINITCQGKISYVGNEYNVSSYSTGKMFVNDIKIAHFAGIKPWNGNCDNYIIWAKYKFLYDKFILNNNPDIPKIIHYSWFGNNKKPALVNDCILSWKNHLKNYIIIEWNENNFDINISNYVRDAYENKKYAFVNDYLRLWTLYNFGGLYLDSDVMVLKNFDKFLSHECFTGKQSDIHIITATMGSKINTKLIGSLLNYYNKLTFNKNVSVETTNTCIISDYIRYNNFIEKEENDYIYLNDGTVIYPITTFCDYNHQKFIPTPSENSYAVHLFMKSWMRNDMNNIQTPNINKMTNNNLDLTSMISIPYDKWQMSLSERLTAFYLIDWLEDNNNCAIEIGSYKGGFTNILNNKFKKVYSCDINHNYFNKNLYKNVTYITGDSKVTVPKLINNINNSNERVSFILIDSDHSYEGVKSDLSNVLKIKPKNDIVILLHDSWYPPTREAICTTINEFKTNYYVKYIETDLCEASIVVRQNVMLGGFCLILMSPEIRNNDIRINQFNDNLFLSMYNHYNDV